MRFFIYILSMVASQLTYATHQDVSARHGMVVSEHRLAAEVGVNILKAGGNAIDAAVAVAYALAVVHPSSGNLGGGGFATVRLKNGKNFFLNFREKAPLTASKKMFLDNKGYVIPNLNTNGYLAVGVPGTVLGLETLLKKYGTMNRQNVMAQAIHLAENGYRLQSADITFLSNLKDVLNTETNIKKIFTKLNGKQYQAGDRLIQKNLAKTLKLISRFGADTFYKGIIAKKIVKASQKHGGMLTLDDFAHYRVEILTPLTCHYHQYTLITSPPPSSGGTTLCEILNILEPYPLKKYGFHSASSIALITEAMRFAFYDRNRYLGDPKFIKNPVAKLTSKQYAGEIRNLIKKSKSIVNDKQITNEKMQTTHFSVMDQFGNAVSITYTLNGYFGAKVVAEDTGFFLNNQMDDFSVKAGETNKFNLLQSSKNEIAPGKQPLSSMTPTIVLQNNQIKLILGSPGGPRIITSTLQVLLNFIDYGLTLQESVNASRFHHQFFPNTIYIEKNGFAYKTLKKLKSKQYVITQDTPWSAVEAIYVDAHQLMHGVNDRRRPAGAALGY